MMVEFKDVRLRPLEEAAASLLGILSWKLGHSVEWDGDRERCINDPEANTLPRRECRKRWKCPEA